MVGFDPPAPSPPRPPACPPLLSPTPASRAFGTETQYGRQVSVRLVDEVAEAEVRRKKKEVKAEKKQKREEKTEREMVRAIRNVVYEILVVSCALVCLDWMDAAGTVGVFLS